MTNTLDDLRSQVRHIVSSYLAPRAAEVDEAECFAAHAVDVARQYGFLAMPLSADLGGINANTTIMCMVLEEWAKGCASSAIVLAGHLTSIMGLKAAGFRKGAPGMAELVGIRDGWVPLWAVCITEPHTGSDIHAIRTTATRTPDGFELHGTKRFITNAGFANWYLVFAQLRDQGIEPGLSAFCVPSGASGVTIGRPERKMGLRGSVTADVIFDHVTLPDTALLGEVGMGGRLIGNIMKHTRANIAAIALGIAEAALALAVDYAKDRVAFGQPISDFQGLQFLLADLAQQVESAKLLTYYAASKSDRGDRDARYYAAMAKRAASDVAMAVTTDAVQVFGGNGYMRDYPVERLMRDAKATQIFEGTNQIQQLIIWRQMTRNLPFLDNLPFEP